MLCHLEQALAASVNSAENVWGSKQVVATEFPNFSHKMAASVGLKFAPSRVSIRSKGVPIRRLQVCRPVRAIELDFSDPDTLLGLAGLVLVS